MRKLHSHGYASSRKQILNFWKKLAFSKSFFRTLPKNGFGNREIPTVLDCSAISRWKWFFLPETSRASSTTTIEGSKEVKMRTAILTKSHPKVSQDRDPASLKLTTVGKRANHERITACCAESFAVVSSKNSTGKELWMAFMTKFWPILSEHCPKP